MNPEHYFFEENQKLLFQFEELLRQKGKNIEYNSPIETIALTIIEMYSTFKKELTVDPQKDYREEWRKAIGLNDIIRKIILAKDCPDFYKLWPHITLLLGESSIVQNIWSPKDDEISNKIFELYMALSSIRIGSNLEIDHPRKSSMGNNPDITLNIGAHKWGFACKTLHSEKIRTLIDRIDEGLSQIERSNADKGIVILNLKNMIDHDKTWPITREPDTDEIGYVTFRSEECIKFIFCQMAQEVFNIVCKELQGEKGFNILFKGRKASSFVLAFFSTVVCLMKDDKPTFTLLRLLKPFDFPKIGPEDLKVAELLNNGMHDRI
jgi:hypothetical protein